MRQSSLGWYTGRRSPTMRKLIGEAGSFLGKSPNLIAHFDASPAAAALGCQATSLGALPHQRTVKRLLCLVADRTAILAVIAPPLQHTMFIVDQNCLAATIRRAGRELAVGQ
jgi:hypothetical protein